MAHVPEPQPLNSEWVLAPGCSDLASQLEDAQQSFRDAPEAEVTTQVAREHRAESVNPQAQRSYTRPDVQVHDAICDSVNYNDRVTAYMERRGAFLDGTAEKQERLRHKKKLSEAENIHKQIHPATLHSKGTDIPRARVQSSPSGGRKTVRSQRVLKEENDDDEEEAKLLKLIHVILTKRAQKRASAKSLAPPAISAVRHDARADNEATVSSKPLTHLTQTLAVLLDSESCYDFESDFEFWYDSESDSESESGSDSQSDSELDGSTGSSAEKSSHGNTQAKGAWALYNAKWKALAEYGIERGAPIQGQIPWPVSSGRLDDVNEAEVRAFFKSIVTNPKTGSKVGPMLLKECNRWERSNLRDTFGRRIFKSVYGPTLKMIREVAQQKNGIIKLFGLQETSSTSTRQERCKDGATEIVYKISEPNSHSNNYLGYIWFICKDRDEGGIVEIVTRHAALQPEILVSGRSSKTGNLRKALRSLVTQYPVSCQSGGLDWNFSLGDQGKLVSRVSKMSPTQLHTLRRTAYSMTKTTLVPFAPDPHNDIRFVIRNPNPGRERRCRKVAYDRITLKEFGLWCKSSITLQEVTEYGKIKTDMGDLLLDRDSRGKLYFRGTLLSESMNSDPTNLTERRFRYGYNFLYSTFYADEIHLSSLEEVCQAILAIWDLALKQHPRCVKLLSEMLNDWRWADVELAQKFIKKDTVICLRDRLFEDKSKWYFSTSERQV
ncbi:hypothetical protein ACHAPJ_002536 [Fusarium lateritium]